MKLVKYVFPLASIVLALLLGACETERAEDVTVPSSSGGTAQTAMAQSNVVETAIGPIETQLGVPTVESVEKLFDEMDFQQAAQAYLWSLPTVGFEYVVREQRNVLGAKNGDVVIYRGYDGVSRFLTPNVTTPYIIGFLDLESSGPFVIQVPAGFIAGSAMDFWQRTLTDFGVTGPDQGNGGRFLFIGPGQERPADLPDDIYIIESDTYGIGFFYRALDSDPEKAAVMERSIKTYPWSERNEPDQTQHIVPEAVSTVTLPRGMEYWEQLASILQREPVIDRDRFFLGMLRNLGIEYGKEFNPDERQKRILLEGAKVGELMAMANSFDKRFPGSRYRPDANWDFLIMADPRQDLPNYSQFEERAAYFYEAVALSEGMITDTPGVGQAYLGSYRDNDGNAFDGGKNYRLRVSPNPPAAQFWSVTVYNTRERAIIRNKERIADRSSRMDLIKNDDGSTDIYFGPKPPEGFEQNWIPTNPGESWFTYFRLYAPLEPYFDRSWPLPDIELID